MDKIYSRPRIIILGKSNKRWNRRNNKFVFFIFIIILCVVIGGSYSLKSAYTVFYEKARSRAKVIGSKIINDSISSVIDNYTYEDFISIENDSNGEINLIKTKVGMINKFKSDINNAVNERFNNNEDSTVNMRLGSFLGNSFFSSMGPTIKIKVEYSGNIESELYSEFEAVRYKSNKT